MMQFSVKAPATSANLGPGFDAIGIALDLWNTVTIDTDGPGGEIINSGSEAALLEGRPNLTLSAMETLAAEFGRPLPGFQLTAETTIPVARGLGSSAAALVSGLVAANHLLDLGLGLDALFERAWDIEGHGDNVGAALYGGAVLAVPGIHRAISLWGDSEPGFSCVVFIPVATGATHAARAALPSHVPHADAAFNLARAAGLCLGLQSRDRELVTASMLDRLHEPYRARLFPHLDGLKSAALEAGALGAALSGAGPTVISLVPDERVAAVATALSETAAQLGAEGRVCELVPIIGGVQLLEAVVTQR